MKLEIGDLVQVRYPQDKFFAGEEVIGIIIETRRSGMMNRMWSITTGSVHLLNKYRDEIKVLNR